MKQVINYDFPLVANAHYSPLSPPSFPSHSPFHPPSPPSPSLPYPSSPLLPFLNTSFPFYKLFFSLHFSIWFFSLPFLFSLFSTPETPSLFTIASPFLSAYLFSLSFPPFPFLDLFHFYPLTLHFFFFFVFLYLFLFFTVPLCPPLKRYTHLPYLPTSLFANFSSISLYPFSFPNLSFFPISTFFFTYFRFCFFSLPCYTLLLRHPWNTIPIYHISTSLSSPVSSTCLHLSLPPHPTLLLPPIAQIPHNPIVSPP